MLRAVTCGLGIVAISSLAGVAQTPAPRDFTPERFYNTFSGAHPPALRIKPGERIVTKTVDAGGTDWNGKPVTQGPNPQTGPFFIEGAEPGDMVAVTFNKIEINRTTAYSSGSLAPYAVTPMSILQRTERQAARSNWILDRVKGTARLAGQGSVDVFEGEKQTLAAKEIVAGYWILQVKSMDEAIEWAKRLPFEAGGEPEAEGEIEIRQLFELEEFGESPAVE